MATSSNPHLSDPQLAPFLLSSFSASSHLNSLLPPLIPPPSLPSTSSRPSNAVPLAALAAQTTALLSTLGLSTSRLLTTLQTLVDEILRIAPRLGYEVDLLRADVGSLRETLESLDGVVEVEKPEGLERLQMLAKVRERVEEVVKVFGDAMDWRLEGGGGGQDPAGEIGYLLASGEVEAARDRVAALRKLAEVFEGTVEGPARMGIVERLEREVQEKGGKKPEEKVVVKEKVEEKVDGGEKGYYGLIEQLKGLRGMS